MRLRRDGGFSLYVGGIWGGGERDGWKIGIYDAFALQLPILPSVATNVHSPRLPAPKNQSTTLVVIILVRRPPPHELRLTPPNINILIQILATRLRRLHILGLRHLRINRIARLLIDILELLFRRDVPLQQLQLQARDRILRAAHALDLFTRAVRGARVGHGVPAVAVGDVFEDQGAVASCCVGFAVGDGGFDGEDVHAVYFEARDVLAALVVVG